MLNLLYFAWVKERMGIQSEAIPMPPSVESLSDLANYLQTRDDAGSRAFAEPNLVRAAVNQVFASPETPVRDGDEIAFFPPVTGG
jgi:molybdopterin synthase sulfur carrier subunit